MKASIFLLLVCISLSCSAQPVPDSKKNVIVFTHVRVIPMHKETVIRDQDVVIKNGIIESIVNSGTITYNKDACIIDGKGKYLMPGLAEMHAHVPPVDDIEPMKKVLTLFLANGVTTIRGMLGHPRHLELRSKIQKGEIIGPRFYTSGPSFNGNTVKSPEAGAAMVRQQKEAGYDFLKLHPGLSSENFQAIAQTAKEVTIPFAGHVSYDVGVWKAIDAGYASIDHMDGFVESLIPDLQKMEEADIGLFGIFKGYLADTTRIPPLMKALREHHIWVVPTQCLAERWFGPGKDPVALSKEPEMIYVDSALLNKWINDKTKLISNPSYNADNVNKFIQLRRKLIYACNRNGVGLLLGSDAPQVFDVPGFSIQHELQYMVDAGLSPYEALCTGTVNPAQYFKTLNTGLIQQGAVADLLLLDANPLESIKNIKSIAGVMTAGRWLSKEWIDIELNKIAHK